MGRSMVPVQNVIQDMFQGMKFQLDMVEAEVFDILWQCTDFRAFGRPFW